MLFAKMDKKIILRLSFQHCSVQFSSVAQSWPTLCDPMNRSTPGLPVHHQLPEFTQTYIHRVTIQPSSVVPFSSCPQSLPASQSFPVSQLFTWGGQSTGVSALASFPPKKSEGWVQASVYELEDTFQSKEPLHSNSITQMEDHRQQQ